MSEPDRQVDPLSVEVGRRLRDRRHGLEATLEAIAAIADVSISHLAEIELGRSSCSLPVLARLSSALDLPMGEILPTLGESPVRVAALGGVAATDPVLSHERLDLCVQELQLRPAEAKTVELESDDATLHVVSGGCSVDGFGATIQLGAGDSLSVRLGKAMSVSVDPAARGHLSAVLITHS